ncbi:MAG: R3H domain-containing nucleic acid-binding protein [Pyrinomonadaceae bacterium]
MNEICENAEAFVAETIADFNFSLEVSASWVEDEGCVLDLTGEDTALVLAENGEMLDAFETLLFQMFGRELDREHRFICDADGFRQTRKSELAAMAKFAAKNVREKGIPFTFGVLNSTERRLIHMALKEEEDLLTESVGQGRDRRLKVSPK